MRWLVPAFLLIATVGARAAEDPLSATLAKMDEAAARFQTLVADIVHVSHTDVLHEDATETGTIRVKRANPKDLHVAISVTDPSPQLAVVDGTKVKIYYPKSGEIQQYDLGRERSLVDQFLLLGFGGNSKDLRAAYAIRVGGAEAIGGEKTTRLELTPKTPDMGTRTKRIDLWISDEKGYTVRQKFYQPGNDYTEITYSKVQLNLAIPDSVFRLDVPKGTRRDVPIKK